MATSSRRCLDRDSNRDLIFIYENQMEYMAHDAGCFALVGASRYLFRVTCAAFRTPQRCRPRYRDAIAVLAIIRVAVLAITRSVGVPSLRRALFSAWSSTT